MTLLFLEVIAYILYGNSLFSVINLFQPTDAFHIEASHLFCWFLYEMPQWAEMDRIHRFL